MDSICDSSFRAGGPSIVANVLSPPTPTAWSSGVSARRNERAPAPPSAVVGGGRTRPDRRMRAPVRIRPRLAPATTIGRSFAANRAWTLATMADVTPRARRRSARRVPIDALVRHTRVATLRPQPSLEPCRPRERTSGATPVCVACCGISVDLRARFVTLAPDRREEFGECIRRRWAERASSSRI